ncbi:MULTISPECIES: hypothetical protein [Pantoea]|uniref:Uncharacterized protein n=1 Tax=Pantoea brenneri TaxID=472694 RepID=A0AAX3JB52_9GAMM|nr:MULTISPECIES: hypothetical protein [Pantoea]KIC85311.1 hypothetical protein RN49_19560 [Pantoea agglomerans]MDU4130121.1 hypothetical protein [Pantoea sp.]VXC45857.1 conserved exported hypothetical protein [Pantoea brenneri]
MKYFLACASVLALSFAAVAAEKSDNVTYTKPSAGRDLHLTCKGYQVKEASVIKIERPSYLEGAGEQVEFAIIAPYGPSDGFKVFFDSWGFTSFGLIESHVMHENWSLVHVGGKLSVKDNKIDYSFFDNQLQDGSSYKPKVGIFLYDCRNSDKRPSWVDRIYKGTEIFNGDIEG